MDDLERVEEEYSTVRQTNEHMKLHFWTRHGFRVLFSSRPDLYGIRHMGTFQIIFGAKRSCHRQPLHFPKVIYERTTLFGESLMHLRVSRRGEKVRKQRLYMLGSWR